ncbi:MAG: hypothetical protein AAGU75_11650 [Bacillota bacterium]
MNKKTKIIALICSVILVLIFILYYYFFVYGFNVSTSMFLDSNVKIKDNIVSITAETASSGYSFAGYDTVWIVDELQIKPRYSISSKYNRSGKLEIIYDTKDRPLHKIILVGITEDDKKEIWPNNASIEAVVYELQETNEPVKPRVVLKDHEQFVFTYSSLSSYLPIGTYEINKDQLILETDDGKYQYVFEIKNNTLIFNKKESSSISLGDVKDGSVFVIPEK